MRLISARALRSQLNALRPPPIISSKFIQINVAYVFKKKKKKIITQVYDTPPKTIPKIIYTSWIIGAEIKEVRKNN